MYHTPLKATRHSTRLLDFDLATRFSTNSILDLAICPLECPITRLSIRLDLPGNRYHLANSMSARMSAIDNRTPARFPGYRGASSVSYTAQGYSILDQATRHSISTRLLDFDQATRFSTRLLDTRFRSGYSTLDTRPGIENRTPNIETSLHCIIHRSRWLSGHSRPFQATRATSPGCAAKTPRIRPGT